MNQEFQILRIRKCDGPHRDIRAYVDLRVGPIKIFGVKIIQDKDSYFCAMPSENFFSQSAGKTLNRAVVHLEDDLKCEIYKEILKRWSELENLKFNEGGG